MLTFYTEFTAEDSLGVRFDSPEAINVCMSGDEEMCVDMENLNIVHTGGGSSAIPTELLPATKTRLGGIIVGNNLSVTENGTLSVDMAEDIEKDNTRPISSAQVYTSIGNINALLGEI